MYRYAPAIHCFQAAERLFQRNRASEANVFAGCYNNLCACYLAMGNVDEAERYATLAIAKGKEVWAADDIEYIDLHETLDVVQTIKRQSNTQLREAYTYKSRGQLLFDRQEYTLALQPFLRALTLFDVLHDTKGGSACCNAIGYTYMKLNNHALAIEYAQR